jgi:hypothetical protein
MINKDILQVSTKLTDLRRRRRIYIDNFGEGSTFKNVNEIREQRPDFFNDVNGCLEVLGRLTLKEGHSTRLDELKDEAYQLIKLG